MKTLIIQGSPRKKAYTKVLAQFAYNHAKTKCTADILDLSEADIEPFKGFEEKYSEKTNDAIKSVKSCDAYILCTPVYDSMISSALKNLFEHINYKEIVGKTAGFIIMASGKIAYLHVHSQLTTMMNYFGVSSNSEAVYASHEHFNEQMNLKDEAIKRRIQEVVDSTIKTNSSG